MERYVKNLIRNYMTNLKSKGYFSRIQNISKREKYGSYFDVSATRVSSVTLNLSVDENKRNKRKSFFHFLYFENAVNLKTKSTFLYFFRGVLIPKYHRGMTIYFFFEIVNKFSRVVNIKIHICTVRNLWNVHSNSNNNNKKKDTKARSGINVSEHIQYAFKGRDTLSDEVVPQI